MSFDTVVQNARASTLVINYIEGATDTERRAFFDKLTPGQRALLHVFARHIYAVGYQEGWEDSRSKP